MSTRALHPPSHSGAAPRKDVRAEADAVPTPAVPKAGAARLARLNAASLPWLGQGGGALLAGYNGPEFSGPAKYDPCSTERR